MARRRVKGVAENIDQSGSEQEFDIEAEGAAPESETPEQRFSRVAASRTSRAITFIRLLGRLAPKQRYYVYTQEQVDAMFSALAKELDDCCRLYQSEMSGAKKGGKQQPFSFDSEERGSNGKS